MTVPRLPIRPPRKAEPQIPEGAWLPLALIFGTSGAIVGALIGFALGAWLA